MITKTLMAAADSAHASTPGWFSAYGTSHLTVLAIFAIPFHQRENDVPIGQVP